jgi:addiction module HigA family antidote
MLREEFLVPMGLSANALALALRVPVTRVSEIVNERRGITADTCAAAGEILSDDTGVLDESPEPL